MINYYDRTAEEQEIITKAYEFEIQAIEDCNPIGNPYKPTLIAMGLWEALEEALEMAFSI